MGKAKGKKANGESGAEVTKVSRKNALRFLPGKTVIAGEGGASGGVEAVAQRAYHIYLEEGCPEGRHLDHWLRAESEIAGSA